MYSLTKNIHYIQKQYLSTIDFDYQKLRDTMYKLILSVMDKTNYKTKLINYIHI